MKSRKEWPFQILYDSESRGYWLNELAFILHHDTDNAIRLSCVDSLLSALDAVRDVVQVMSNPVARSIGDSLQNEYNPA